MYGYWKILYFSCMKVCNRQYFVRKWTNSICKFSFTLKVPSLESSISGWEASLLFLSFLFFFLIEHKIYIYFFTSLSENKTKTPRHLYYLNVQWDLTKRFFCLQNELSLIGQVWSSSSGSDIEPNLTYIRCYNRKHWVISLSIGGLDF